MYQFENFVRTFWQPFEFLLNSHLDGKVKMDN